MGTLLQFLLLLFIHCFFYSVMTTYTNDTEYQALLSLKSKITHDPFGVFTSWNASAHFCQWQGITCGRRHRRVTVIDFNSKALVGSVSPYIGNLTFLREISLFNNSLHGPIPTQISRLFMLQVLTMQNNSFTGQIPSNLSHCVKLQHLYINYNNIQGRVPATIGDLFNLQFLAISDNLLHGQIPESVGNLSSLQQLSAAYNFLEGSIPNSFGRLKRLTALGLGANNLSGVVPPSVYNLSSISIFSLGENGHIQGHLPSNLGILFPRLQKLELSNNQFVGEIPVSLSNASQLQTIWLVFNHFTGPVPRNLGTLQNLHFLLLSNNNLGTGQSNDMDWSASLVNCTQLKYLQAGSNQFGGSLPMEIANYSIHLTDFQIADNQVSGTITSGVSNLVNLVIMDLSMNRLTGSIPNSIGQLRQLNILGLYSNRLTGEVPLSLGNISWLTKLYLDDNSLQGSIPTSLQNCKNLLELDLSVNNLSGSLPNELFNVSSLSIALNLSHNHFKGSLPSSVQNMKTLGELDISWNKLSGRIPDGLGSCISLESLFMQHNSFEGSLPSSFSSLVGIQLLDLSQNNLTGLVPDYLERFKLLYLNLSFNNFEGEVPTNGIFSNYSVMSVTGNGRLCGGIPELLLPTCPMKKANHRKFSSSRTYVIIIIGCCIFVGLIVLFLWSKKKKSDHVSVGSLKDPYPQVSYEQILRATDSFSSSNLIGIGSFGSVYKGSILENGQLAAIKVLNLQRRGASRSFTAECEALRNYRHRNLVKIITSCSSIDFRGNDFKALIFEYMLNGSLERWLHPLNIEMNQVNQSLNLSRRLNVAIDVACALDYLHHGCEEPIIHCDLKPSNVLLDSEMTGHVGDFGLARILGDDVMKPNVSSSIGVKGTIGYAAPEYGLGGEVSREGDVYSFGILLLEIMTGKRPTDNMFENGLNIHKFASKAISDGNAMEIVDACIVANDENGEMKQRKTSRNDDGRIEECVSGMVEIGVACSMDSPSDRMHMNSVVQKLLKVRDALRKS